MIRTWLELFWVLNSIVKGTKINSDKFRNRILLQKVEFKKTTVAHLACVLSLANPNFALNSFFRVEFASEFIFRALQERIQNPKKIQPIRSREYTLQRVNRLVATSLPRPRLASRARSCRGGFPAGGDRRYARSAFLAAACAVDPGTLSCRTNPVQTEGFEEKRNAVAFRSPVRGRARNAWRVPLRKPPDEVGQEGDATGLKR